MGRGTYNVRLLKAKRSYTMNEISEVFGIHVRTVQSWRKSGMSPIDPDDRPFLFLGKDIGQFLVNRRNSSKIKLKENEFYCPRCRFARQSFQEKIDIVYTGKRLGLVDELILVKGICVKCQCRLNRFAKKSAIKSSILYQIYRKAQDTLKGNSRPIVNADLFGEL
jgi:hypothetical protein